MGKELDLQKACQNADPATVKKILQKCCRPVQKRETNRTSRLGAFSSKRTLNINFQDEHGRTCLHFAATVGDVSMLEDLLICSADPSLKEGRGQTALHYATMHNKTPGIVDLLIKFGAPVSLQDMHLNNALHLAAMFGNVTAARELVRYDNVGMSAVNSKGYTPMDVCCLYGHSKIAGILLQTHSDDILTMGSVAARHDNTCTTPLHLAARKGHSDTCLLLLKHGLNVNRESTSGTALHEAVLHSRMEVTQLLCEHGADVTIKNVHGQTPLDVAQTLSAAHSADKLATILHKFRNQESMVGQAMEVCTAEQPADLELMCGELVHILSKNTDGRWRAFVIRGQTQKAGLVPWYKLELLSAHCKPASYMRASSQVLSERDLSQFSSQHSLTPDYPTIPGNERTHSVSVNGVCVNEPTARLLLQPEAILPDEDSQGLMYDWLNGVGLGQHLKALLDCGYDSPLLLVGITEAELDHIGITDSNQKAVLLKAASTREKAPRYALKAAPDSLEDWLQALGVGTYGPLFSGAGFEYLDDVLEVSAITLVKLGVTKPGHRTKILAAIVGLKEWLADHPLPPRPVSVKPRKPARSMSKNSNVSFDASRTDESVLRGIRLQDEPICNSFWESDPTAQAFRTSSTHIACEEEESRDEISCVSQPASVAEEVVEEEEEKEEDRKVSTNPFDSDTEDELPVEIPVAIKPKRKAQVDSLSSLPRDRFPTDDEDRCKELSSPPLSPGEALWDSANVLNSSPCYAASNTSSDNLHVIKRGSSEHLDPMSPPPAATANLPNSSHSPLQNSSCSLQAPSPNPNPSPEEIQDCVDLIREASPSDSKRVSQSSLSQQPPPSPNGYYESDIFLISTEKENVQMNPKKPMRRSMTVGDTSAGKRGDPKTTDQSDICRTCKLTKDPDLAEHKKIFLEKLEKRMSGSDAMKNINWSSMSPEVAAVVKSVYADDTQDISRQQNKKVPPPVAPKPKYSLKKANTAPLLRVQQSKPIENEIEESPATTKPDLPPVLERSSSIDNDIQKQTSGNVFDDLENMFDEFSKELDSFLT